MKNVTSSFSLPKRYKLFIFLGVFLGLANQIVLLYLLLFVEPATPIILSNHAQFKGLPPDLDWKKLEAGEILVEQNQSGSVVECYFLADGSATGYFKMLTDLQNLPLIFPDLKKVKTKFENDSLAIVEFEGDYSLFSANYTLLREYFPNTITWRQLSGPFKSFTGTWKLFSRGEKTLIYYRTEVVLPELVPKKLVRHFLKESLPAMVQKMKQRVSEYKG